MKSKLVEVDTKEEACKCCHLPPGNLKCLDGCRLENFAKIFT